MTYAAAYDTPIFIDRPIKTQDPDFGTDIVTWQSISGTHTIWAFAADQRPSRSEAVEQGLAVATALTTIRIPYRNDVDSSMRVRMRGNVYNIVGGPAQIGRGRELEMVVEHHSSQGD